MTASMITADLMRYIFTIQYVRKSVSENIIFWESWARVRPGARLGPAPLQTAYTQQMKS